MSQDQAGIDESAIKIARDIAAGRIDRMDGIWRLGGSVYNTSFYDMGSMGVLVGAFDELESAPRTSLRDLWNEEAYERERARGEAILARYGDAIDEAITLVASRRLFGKD